METNWSATILAATGSTVIQAREVVQSLWSGYGELVRYQLAGGKYSTVIAKEISLQAVGEHPRGWQTSASHHRKLKSYLVEATWYSEFASRTGTDCRVPEMIYHQTSDKQILLLMEDLNGAGFSLRKSSIDQADIRACLEWLAALHARFMNAQPDGLWEVGSYWHLATRQEELQAMTNHRLREAAGQIDLRLREAKYKTIVHGDAKLANFCFSPGGGVAAVDFQYAGGGCGMKDVAYFLSSCLSADALDEQEADLLHIYFTALEQALRNYKPGVDGKAVTTEWKILYKYAWADFCRFLDGWSPGHWKMHKYSLELTEEVLREVLK